MTGNYEETNAARSGPRRPAGRGTGPRHAVVKVGAEQTAALVVNISLLGALLTTSSPLRVGQRVTVCLAERDGAAIELPGVVLYHGDQGYGCAFDAISPDRCPRLTQWIAGMGSPKERVVSTDRVDWTRGDNLVRLTVSGEIQGIMERVFTSARAEDVGTLLQGMLTKPCLQRSVHLLRNSDRGCVGFNLITVQDVAVSAARRYAVFSSVAAVLPEYRGDNSTMAAALKEAMIFGLRHPRRPTYLFLRLVHPSSYRLFARHAPVMHERFNDETPAEIRALMLACLNADGLRWEERNGGFMVQESYLRVDESSADEQRWRRDARTARFMANNPAYAQGSGLCVLMPMGPAHLLGAYRSFLLRRTGSVVRRALPARAHGALSRLSGLLDRWKPPAQRSSD